MAAPKGHPRYGGRQKGSVNKRSSEEASIFEALAGPRGEAYADQLHAIATGQHGDHHARLKALQIIAPYLWRKRPLAVEHQGPDGGPIAVQTTVVHEHRPAADKS